MQNEEIIEKDRKNFPNCQYSISMSETCQDVNGNFTCELLKNYQRICPGQAPKTFFSKTEQHQGQSAAERMPNLGSPFGFSFGSVPFSQREERSSVFGNDIGGFNIFDPFGMAENFFNNFAIDFGSQNQELPNNHLFQNLPPHRSLPPQSSPFNYINSDDKNVKIEGKISGPVEEI